ncbi:MAG: thymidylate synthase [Clostridiales Family XIII bacterium]|nr:thymidylate synthase [Clostridiales Family XIII bacterium]
MKELFIEGRSLPEAYHKAIDALLSEGEVVDCPAYGQLQREASMTIVVHEPLAEPRISKLMIGGPHELQQYEMEMLDGILDFIIGKGETLWEYTYHDRYAHQLDFVIEELKRDAYTRRAIMNLRNFDVDSSNDDPACLQSIQYFIRDGQLHCKILFRSNDLPEAFYFNAFALIRLQEKVAAAVGVPVGTYTHRANSMHAYEKNFPLLEGYVDNIKGKPFEELTYHYEDFYQELMEEEIPSILEMVKSKRAQYGVE